MSVTITLTVNDFPLKTKTRTIIEVSKGLFILDKVNCDIRDKDTHIHLLKKKHNIE